MGRGADGGLLVRSALPDRRGNMKALVYDAYGGLARLADRPGPDDVLVEARAAGATTGRRSAPQGSAKRSRWTAPACRPSETGRVRGKTVIL